MKGTAMTKEEQKRKEAIAGLKELVKFLEDNPKSRPPDSKTLLCYHFCMDKEELLKTRRELGGTWKKEMSDVTGNIGWFNLVRAFGPYSYQLYVNREQMCKFTEVEEVVKVKKWVCDDLLEKETK